MTERIFFNLSENQPNLSEEFVPQALLAPFIPVELLAQISLGLGPDDEPIAHFLREVMRA